MEEQILRYYLKVFSLIIVTSLIITFLYAYYVLNRNLDISDKLITIKKGERIGNPDLAHRVSKKYNVTTSNLGLDNPLINRVIVKPNERDISNQRWLYKK